MAFTANAIGRVRVSGVDTQGAFFDPSLCSLTDGAATSATGTAPVFTSASYNFVAGDVNAYVFIKSGTNWMPGWYKISSVAANAATLDAVIGDVRLYASTTPAQDGSLGTFNLAAGCASTASPTGATWSVDYTQQDAAIGASSDYTSAASTTITSVLAGFTAAMVGNAIRISSGTGATTGYYFITAYSSATQVTVDKVSGTYTVGVGKVGGAAATCARVLNSANATGDKAIAGNIVFIRGAGSDSPGSDDYTTTGFITPSLGASSNWVKLIGENGRPRLKSDGLMFYQCSNLWFENLYITTSSNSNGSNAIVNFLTRGRVCNCVIDMAGKATCAGISVANANTINDCEIKSGISAVTFSSGSFGIMAQVASYGTAVRNCYIHHTRDSGITMNTNIYGITIEENIIYACAGDSIACVTGLTDQPMVIINNTIDAGLGHGITVVGSSIFGIVVTNNAISNHVGSSKYALNWPSGIQANDLLKSIVDYNDVYNCTGSYNNITPGAHDLALDPQYTAAGSDWSIGTNLKAKGTPGLIRKTSSTSYVDIGALQRQEAGGVIIVEEE